MIISDSDKKYYRWNCFTKWADKNCISFTEDYEVYWDCWKTAVDNVVNIMLEGLL